MAGGVIYLDVDDEITSAAARIRTVEGRRVALVLPHGSRVATSRINFRLLARDALTHEKRLVDRRDRRGDAGARGLGRPAGLRLRRGVRDVAWQPTASPTPPARLPEGAGLARRGRGRPGRRGGSSPPLPRWPGETARSQVAPAPADADPRPARPADARRHGGGRARRRRRGDPGDGGAPATTAGRAGDAGRAVDPRRDGRDLDPRRVRTAGAARDPDAGRARPRRDDHAERRSTRRPGRRCSSASVPSRWPC